MRRGTRATLIILVAAILAGQGIALHHKLPVYQPGPRKVVPVFLGAFAARRVGYVHGHHGAVLVRLRPGVAATLQAPPEEPGEIAEAMQLELKRIPLKAGAEAVWYFLVFFGVIFLPLRWAWRRHASRRLFALAGAAALFTAAGLLQAPIFFGYDASIFSNWVGPGAYSYSTSALAVTGIPGITVSYRTFLEAMMAPPAKLLLLLFSEGGPLPLFVLFIAFIYSLLGALAGFLAATLHSPSPVPSSGESLGIGSPQM